MARKYIIGIDEVGRGCLAGPVTVTALAIPEDFDFRIFDFDLGVYSSELESSHKHVNAKPILRDSKKLTAKQRQDWLVRIKEAPEIRFVTKSIKPNVVDRINISGAANLAAYRAFTELNRQLAEISAIESEQGATTGKIESGVYLDGGLYIRSKQYQRKNLIDAETLIKGDELVPAISLASIVAKVHRDRQMVRLHKIYPMYGFDVHKGYATKAHRDAIKKHGATELHRKSFLKGIST